MTVRCLSIVLTLLLLQSCRGPRDPDLDRRLSEAAIEQSLPPKAPTHEEAPAATTTNAAAPGEDDESGLPPAGSVELRPYDTKELLAIMKSVPRAEELAATATDQAYEARIKTGLGDIVCTLDHQRAPQTTVNFIALANGKRPWRDPDTKEIARTPFFDGLLIHRTIKDFIVQTGKPGTGASSGPGWTIPREAGTPSNFDAPGSMGMVDAGEDTHASQFFITLRAQKSLKEKYTPFGTCGPLDLLKRIANAEKRPPKTASKSATKPLKPVRIVSIRVTAVPPAKAAPAPSPAPKRAPDAPSSGTPATPAP
jgi:cyclophilin family peptidyl-prolyl cis-trans isomerase